MIKNGTAEKLGASFDGSGVNFAIFSAHATKVELCLFENGVERRVQLPAHTGDIWHGYVEGLKPGQLYGYRVHGPYAPHEGHRFDATKVLLDPYAREVEGTLGRVTEPPQKAKPPVQTQWEKTVIYELHPKGYTMADSKVPEKLRGTVAALGEKSVIQYLKDLGVTDVELMPIHAKTQVDSLKNGGRGNYWGYNSMTFNALEPTYLQSGKRAELRDAVEKLGDAGIGVIIDVVFNHTGEGDAHGPTLSYRGIDNASYYRLNPHDKSKYMDLTGCGNTLNINHPQVIRLVIDSLRSLVDEFGVAGFRFDLASALGRNPYHFDAEAPLFQAIAADSVLSKVKLIAEPWDCTHEGYQTGHYGALWHEWNDKFRDDVRRFWREDAHMVGHMATRLAGSSHEFDKPGRGPLSGINFVTCHDGFTLQDLVSYNIKHNETNGEHNRDGNDNNISSNNGAEGETESAEINALRERQKRNIMASLFLAQGVPMMLAGDEFGNSQGGNNNAYCQDNETGWLNWDKITGAGKKFHGFVKNLIKFRKAHPILQQAQYRHDIEWISPVGGTPDWHNSYSKCFGMMLKDKGETLLAVFNAASNPVDFTLPEGKKWRAVLDTTKESGEADFTAEGSYCAPQKSTTVFILKQAL